MAQALAEVLPGLKATLSPVPFLSTLSITLTPLVAPSPCLMGCTINKTPNSSFFGCC